MKWYCLAIFWKSGEVSKILFTDEKFCETVAESFRASPKVDGCIITEEVRDEKSNRSS